MASSENFDQDRCRVMPPDLCVARRRLPFTANGPLRVCRAALLHHRDNGPIATMARRVTAAQLRRIKSRGRASVEKEGVPTAQAVAEKKRKIVKVDQSFGEDEMHLGPARYADAVPERAIG